MTSTGESGAKRLADARAGGERRARAALAGEDGTVEALVARLRGAAELRGSFTAWHEIPARPARAAGFPEGLADELVALFRRRGWTELYEHQARAIELALSGHDVLVATPTASGKTM